MAQIPGWIVLAQLIHNTIGQIRQNRLKASVQPRPPHLQKPMYCVQYASPLPSRSTTFARFMPRRILIVDDNAGVRSLIRTYLEMQTEFDVCGEAADGVDAIEKIKELNPDLVLLDLAMPRMNGAEAASIIKGSMPHLRIILFSVHGEKIGKALASAVGVDAVLSKPDGIASLVESVRNLLGPA